MTFAVKSVLQRLDQHGPEVFGSALGAELRIALATHHPHAHRFQVQVLFVVFDRQHLVIAVACPTHAIRVVDATAEVIAKADRALRLRCTGLVDHCGEAGSVQLPEAAFDIPVAFTQFGQRILEEAGHEGESLVQKAVTVGIGETLAQAQVAGARTRANRNRFCSVGDASKTRDFRAMTRR